MARPVHVTEELARSVAEEAREADSGEPPFAKESFPGRLRTDLIHPLPWTGAGRRIRSARRASALHRTLFAQVRPVHVLQDGALAGRVREAAGPPRPDRRHRETPIADLFLVGAWTNSGGMNPAITSGLVTARRVLEKSRTSV